MYLATIHWKDASNANTNPRCTKEEKVTQAFPLLCTPLLTAAPAAAPAPGAVPPWSPAPFGDAVLGEQGVRPAGPCPGASQEHFSRFCKRKCFVLTNIDHLALRVLSFSHICLSRHSVMTVFSLRHQEFV